MLKEDSEQLKNQNSMIQRKFNAELNLTPMTYLSRWIIAMAYQLVKSSSHSLDYIADCGVHRLRRC